MAIIYDVIDPVELTGYARDVPEPPEYGLSPLLPPRVIPDIEYDFKTTTRSNRAARYRAWDAETPIGKRDGFATTKGAIPPLGEKRVIGEYERIQLERARGANDGRLVENIYDDTDANILAVRARLELARGDVLSDGKFTLDGENGLTIEVDFLIPETNFVNPAVVWSDHANAKVLSDMLAWTVAATKANRGARPAAGYTDSETIGHVQRNLELRNIAGTVNGVPNIVNQANVDAVFAAYNLPPLRPMEHSILDGETDEEVSVLPAGTIIFLPATPVGRTVFGITAEALELVEARRLAFADAPGLVAVTLKEGDPVRIWSKGGGTAMPVLENPDGVFVAEVNVAA